MNPLKSIRAKCVDCMGAQASLVSECEIESCALHPFRMGRNPFRTKRILTDEQKAAVTARFAAARKAKTQ